MDAPLSNSSTLTFVTYLLGETGFRQVWNLQERIAATPPWNDQPQIDLLLCEHPLIITVGRGGNENQIDKEISFWRRQNIEIVHVPRGGETFLHLPGQLAVYPLFPWRRGGIGIGRYLETFQRGIGAALKDLRCQAEVSDDRLFLVGRSGIIAQFGLRATAEFIYFGCHINVTPNLGFFRLIETGGGQRAGSLMAERQGRVSMSAMRSAVAVRLSDAFQATHTHIHHGHPLLQKGECV